jgi:hypothetical protein
MNIEQIKGVLMNPRHEWQEIAEDTMSIQECYKGFIMILAAIGPVASIIGMSLVGVSLPFSGSFRVPLTTSVASAAVNYLMTLGGVYLLALIIDALAPTFGGEKNLLQAFKIAAYSSIPGWLAGIFTLVPALAFLGIIGLYGLYLLFLGLPLLMQSPKEKSLGYTIAVIVAAVVMFMVIGMVSHSFVSYPAPTISMPGIQ